MVVGILPVVGAPLPFMSYGGTSMLTVFAALGIIMSIKDLSQSMLDASKSVLELSEMKVGIQIVRGSESKLMPLAKKAGVRFMKPKPGDDEAHVMGDKGSIMKFMLSRGMSKDDVLDVHPELKEETNDPRASTTRRLLKYIARASGLETEEVQRRATRKQRALVHVTGWMALALVARDQGLDMDSVIQALS